MFYYTQRNSFSPLKYSTKPLFLKEQGFTPIMKTIVSKPVLLKKVENFTEEKHEKNHRKSLSSTHRGYFEESLEKREKNFEKLEKTIENVLEQSRRTKALIKEFMTPYKEKKYKGDACEREKETFEKEISATATFNEEKEYSFRTPGKEGEKEKEKEEDFLGFLDNLEDLQEEKDEKIGFFGVEKMGFKEDKIGKKEEKMGFKEEKTGFKKERLCFQEGKKELNSSKMCLLEENQEILKQKFQFFDIQKHLKDSIKIEVGDILEKIDAIEKGSGLDFKKFIKELYDSIKKEKDENVFQEKTLGILNEKAQISQRKKPEKTSFSHENDENCIENAVIEKKPLIKSKVSFMDFVKTHKDKESLI